MRDLRITWDLRIVKFLPNILPWYTNKKPIGLTFDLKVEVYEFWEKKGRFYIEYNDIIMNDFWKQ